LIFMASITGAPSPSHIDDKEAGNEEVEMLDL
jgi:hypothetical protein